MKEFTFILSTKLLVLQFFIAVSAPENFFLSSVSLQDKLNLDLCPYHRFVVPTLIFFAF
jgi:hypothetical protein